MLNYEHENLPVRQRVRDLLRWVVEGGWFYYDQAYQYWSSFILYLRSCLQQFYKYCLFQFQSLANQTISFSRYSLGFCQQSPSNFTASYVKNFFIIKTSVFITAFASYFLPSLTFLSSLSTLLASLCISLSFSPTKLTTSFCRLLEQVTRLRGGEGVTGLPRRDWTVQFSRLSWWVRRQRQFSSQMYFERRDYSLRVNDFSCCCRLLFWDYEVLTRHWCCERRVQCYQCSLVYFCCTSSSYQHFRLVSCFQDYTYASNCLTFSTYFCSFSFYLVSLCIDWSSQSLLALSMSCLALSPTLSTSLAYPLFISSTLTNSPLSISYLCSISLKPCSSFCILLVLRQAPSLCFSKMFLMDRMVSDSSLLVGDSRDSWPRKERTVQSSMVSSRACFRISIIERCFQVSSVSCIRHSSNDRIFSWLLSQALLSARYWSCKVGESSLVCGFLSWFCTICKQFISLALSKVGLQVLYVLLKSERGARGCFLELERD